MTKTVLHHRRLTKSSVNNNDDDDDERQNLLEKTQVQFSLFNGFLIFFCHVSIFCSDPKMKIDGTQRMKNFINLITFHGKVSYWH